jgi:ABC transporter substrate binding protein (PQQ-dependent alcohol dehydrogenase system)
VTDTRPQPCTVRVRALAPLLAALCLFVPAASLAQGIPTEPLVVGVVVPVATGDPLADAVAKSAADGAVMADDEFAFNAEMLGIDFSVITRQASGADAVVAAAEELVAEGAYVVAGGFSLEEAAALAAWSAEAGVPYLNVGSSADALRQEQCQPTTLHIEPSAAMYLDSLAGWYVRSGFRDWFFVRGSDAESSRQLQRVQRGLRERHFGARSVGDVAVEPGGDLGQAVDRVRRSGADLVLLLLPADEQLRVLAALEEAGVQAEVTGFPYPEAQTRAFYQASREAAPRLGAGHRASAWEATLDAYGARELNARFRQFFGGQPMEAPAWAVYQAVKLAYEAAFFGGGTDAESVLTYLEAPTTVFDVWKGIGTTFRPWDGQLRQSLYLVKVSETETDPFTLVTLVGELPAIYMPGTDPVERLDQIGDLAAASSCRR